MIMAAVVWFLGLIGVAPTDAELTAMVDEHNLRGHHLSFDFGALHGDVERKPGIGIGWEYYVDRRFHGVSFEILGVMLGRPFKVDEDYWLAAGIGWFPVRAIKLFVQAGPMFQVEPQRDLDSSNDIVVHGRVGIGYRFPFFVGAVMPFVTIGATSTAELTWTLGARLQY